MVWTVANHNIKHLLVCLSLFFNDWKNRKGKNKILVQFLRKQVFDFLCFSKNFDRNFLLIKKEMQESVNLLIFVLTYNLNLVKESWFIGYSWQFFLFRRTSYFLNDRTHKKGHKKFCPQTIKLWNNESSFIWLKSFYFKPRVICDRHAKVLRDQHISGETPNSNVGNTLGH